jgi:hypothetical protein
VRKDRGKIDFVPLANLCPLSELQSMALRWCLARKWESHKIFLYLHVTEGIWREVCTNFQKRGRGAGDGKGTERVSA